MCYFFSVTSGLKELENYYDFVESTIKNYDNYNILKAFEHPKVPIVTKEGIVMSKWGLIPYWVDTREKAMDYRKYTYNARMETIFSKVSFRHSINKKRCLIPCNSFYEYQHKDNKKIPYKITLFPKKIFSLAGVYDEWIDKETDKIYRGFSLITTKANKLMAEIHNSKERMPVILPNRREELLWLKDTEKYILKELMATYDYDGLEAEELNTLEL